MGEVLQLLIISVQADAVTGSSQLLSSSLLDPADPHPPPTQPRPPHVLREQSGMQPKGPQPPPQPKIPHPPSQPKIPQYGLHPKIEQSRVPAPTADVVDLGFPFETVTEGMGVDNGGRMID